MTRQGVYPSLPVPNGIPWSEYVRTHGNKPQSVSSSTEALESDHARFVTRTIAQHARSMATHTRSLPTDSPVPFQQNERRHMSEGSLEGILPYRIPSEHTINIGGIDYHSEITETDRVSTFMGLDDYDTLFAARHGRGALDLVPKIAEIKDKVTTGITSPMVGPELHDSVEKPFPVHDDANLQQREQMQLRAASPKTDIIGEGAAIFTDMTETILDALDKQVIASPGSQQLPKDDQEITEPSTPGIRSETFTQKEDYPDLFLPIRENYRISDRFRGYAESLSIDNNPMVLVELDNLSYRYGTSLYAVDRVNGTMYGKFSIGYRLIPEKATVIPQYQHISGEDVCIPTYENTFLGVSSLPTPIAKSTPVTHASHMPTSELERDIVQPIASEEARAAYFEECMKNMSGVRLPLSIPSKVKESSTSADLVRRIDIYCNEQNEKRRQERESHKQALDALEERKKHQCKKPDKEENKAVYSQIAQNMENTREMVRRSMSRASTISTEEKQMALTEKEFAMIRQKMDKIDHRLNEMYKNWHTEYGNANTLEECEEIKNFYKPYLDKYESKYRVLYQLL